MFYFHLLNVFTNSVAKVSETMMQLGYLDESLDYAGRSLVLRVKDVGLAHDKTAEARAFLGGIYEKMLNFELALKEYTMCE